MPFNAPSSRAHMPAQFTTTSQAISPWLVRTPATPPSRVRTSCTAVSSRMRAPPVRAPAATDLVAIHDVRLDPCVAAERDGPAELRHARRAPGDAEAAHLLPVGAHAGLGLEPRVELGAVADEPGHRARAAEAADEPGGVPGRAARELLALEQNDVTPAELDQVIGDAAAGDAATDDDDAGLGHGRAP